MSNTKRLKIWLISGEVLSYEFEPRTDGQWSTAGRIGKIVEAGHIRVRVEGSLIIFPLTSILRVEVSPVPDDLTDVIARPVEPAYVDEKVASSI